MLSSVYLVIAVVDFILLVYAIQLNRKYPSTALLLVTLPLLLLWYDNIIIATGAMIGEGELLKALNTPRFLAHYILVPLAIIGLGSMAKQAGFRWAQPKWVMGAFCVLATGFIVQDLWLFYNSTLYPACFKELLRYTTHISEFTACGPDAAIGTGKPIPPIPAVALSNMKVIFGIYLWWKIGYKWLFLGSVFALGFFAVPFGPSGGVYSNIGEPIISLVIVLTAVHITKHRDSWQHKL